MGTASFRQLAWHMGSYNNRMPEFLRITGSSMGTFFSLARHSVSHSVSSQESGVKLKTCVKGQDRPKIKQDLKLNKIFPQYKHQYHMT